MKIRNLFVLAVFVLVGLWARTSKIEKVPPQLSNDEISIAYDAYSLSRTGKDEHGNYLPLSFQSHGNYKAPLYAYLSAPLYKFLPNNSLVAKIPSLVAGILTCLFLAMLVNLLFSNKNLGILAGIFLLVTPWHVYTSRMVLESNLALFFLVAGLYFLFKAFKSQKIFWTIFSGISFSLSMYAYHAEWFLVPWLIVLVAILFGKQNKKLILCMVITAMLCLSPMVYDLATNPKSKSRADSQFIWKAAAVEDAIKQKKNVFSKGAVVAKSISENYLEYINPSYIFYSGLDILENKSPVQIGLFLWPSFVFMLAGLGKMWQRKKELNIKFVWLWLAISPMVSAITLGTNMVRNLVTVAPICVILAIGWQEVWQKNKLISFLITLVALIVGINSFFTYRDIFPVVRGVQFQNYREVAKYLANINFKQVVMDYRYGDKSNYFTGVPHLYLAYYLEMNPQLLQNRIDEKDGMRFGRFKIKQIDWGKEVNTCQTLFVSQVQNSPIGSGRESLFSKIAEIPDASGVVAQEIYESKKESCVK